MAVLAFIVACSPKRDAGDDSVKVTASTTESQARSCGEPIITADGIGKLKLGMTADSLKAICPIAFDTLRPGPEGETQRVMMVAFPPSGVEAEIVNDTVWRLDVRTPGISTIDSLQVGSSLGEVIKHGDAQGLIGEGNFVLVFRNRCGISFEVRGGIPPGRPRVWSANELAKLPADTPIERIMLFKCPPEARAHPEGSN